MIDPHIAKELQPIAEELNAIVRIAMELKPIVKEWIVEFCCSDVKGAHDLGAQKWKQRLKNTFVQMTQFGTDDPYERKKNGKGTYGQHST